MSNLRGSVKTILSVILLWLGSSSMAYEWTQLELGTGRNQYWQYVSASSDGTVILGRFGSNYTYYEDKRYPSFISRDSGSTWTLVPMPSGMTYPTWMNMTQDGGTIFVHSISVNNHLMYKSTDDGALWTSFNILGGESFAPTTFTMNSDASVIVCVGGTQSVNGFVSISVNSGASFSAYRIETSPTLKFTPGAISVNEAGTKLICRGTS